MSRKKPLRVFRFAPAPVWQGAAELLRVPKERVVAREYLPSDDQPGGCAIDLALEGAGRRLVAVSRGATWDEALLGIPDDWDIQFYSARSGKASQ
jgi:hypothetical protein